MATGAARHVRDHRDRVRPALEVAALGVATKAQLDRKASDRDLAEGPRAAWTNLMKVYTRLKMWPIDDSVPPDEEGAIEALPGDVRHRTAPDDRRLITGAFAPEVYLLAERLFAGGQVCTSCCAGKTRQPISSSPSLAFAPHACR